MPAHPMLPSRHTRRRGLAALSAGTCTLAMLASAPAAPAATGDDAPPEAQSTSRAEPDASRGGPQPIVTTRWGAKALKNNTGRHSRTRFRNGAIEIGRNPVRVRYDDPYSGGGKVAYDRGIWRSRWVRPGIRFDELIPSWDVAGRRGTFVQVWVRGRKAGGATGSWDSLGRWGFHDKGFHRMSRGAQRDDSARVAVDTLKTNGGRVYTAWQVKVDLYRRAGTRRTPGLRRLNVMTSNLPSTNRPTSSPLRNRKRVLKVPKYSQMLHQGTYPQWDNGGEAWCSPTSTSMVMGRWGRLPKPAQYKWVSNGKGQPWVVYAARFVYDYTYQGAGNWPFNTAYASRHGLDAFVTRLRSLRDAERLVRKGIPVVVTISFGPGELRGAPLSSTAGHLMVIRGFTAKGGVIVNDPAAPNRKTVRRVYNRRQFENAWIDNTRGTSYVIHPDSVALPAPSKTSLW